MVSTSTSLVDVEESAFRLMGAHDFSRDALAEDGGDFSFSGSVMFEDLLAGVMGPIGTTTLLSAVGVTTTPMGRLTAEQFQS